MCEIFECSNTCEYYSKLCFIQQRPVLLTSYKLRIVVQFRRRLASIFLS